MAALQRVAADVAPLRSATRLNPAVGRLVDFWNGQERRICRYETNSCLIDSLLIYGIPSSVFAIAVDILAALTYQGYSYAHQSVSELSAIGAPPRSFVVTTGFVCEALLIAFSAGVWLSAGTKRSLRLAAIFIALWGIVDLIGSLFSSFFSMQMRGGGKSCR